MKRRSRRRRTHAAAAAAQERQASVSASVLGNSKKAHDDARGLWHDNAIRKPENNKGGAISTRGDSPQKTSCSLDAHWCDGLAQTTSNQMANSNDARKRNFQPGNKDVRSSKEGGADNSYRAQENSVVENRAAWGQVFKKDYVSCLHNHCGTQGNTSINMDHWNHDPEVKKIGLAGSLEGEQGKTSPNCGLSQNSEECKKARNGCPQSSSSLKEKKKKQKEMINGKENNHLTESTSQNSLLPAGADSSGLMAMVGENNKSDLKHMESRGKKNQNKVAMANSVYNAKIKEGTGVTVYSAVEKKDDVVQTRSFGEKEIENVAKPFGSCMPDSNRVASTNVSSIPLQGRVGANVNTNCLQSTTDEKVCQSSVHVGYTKPFSVVSRFYSSEDNQNVNPMKKAVPCTSFISNVRKNQSYQLNPLNEGANFFQMGYPVSNYVSDAYYGTNIFESGALGNSEYKLGRSYLDRTIAERNKLQEKEVAWLTTDHNINSISPSTLAQEYEEKLKVTFSPCRIFNGFQRKKLLILDLNGLLADINQDNHNAHLADAKVRGKLVFRRPFCNDFLIFCIQNFELGIWSSRKRENVDSVVDILMRDFKPYLMFCWDLSKCTFTGHKTLENIHKPLVLKELRKLWNKEEPGLPWEMGNFSPSNTLLVDDSPYKALRNPPHTAIFPHPYNYHNRNDNSLGPGGDLRVYLEKLAVAGDVEHFVRHNPFGQPFISQSDPHWNFYAQIAGGNVSLTCRA